MILYSSISDMLYKFSSVCKFICVHVHCLLFIAQYNIHTSFSYLSHFILCTSLCCMDTDSAPIIRAFICYFSLICPFCFAFESTFRYIAYTYLSNRFAWISSPSQKNGWNFSRREQMPPIQHILICVTIHISMEIVDASCIRNVIYCCIAIWEKTAIVINHYY